MVQRSQQRTTVLLIPKTCQFLRQQLVFQTWLMDAESTRTQRGKLWKASPNNPQTPQTYCTYSILFYCFFLFLFFLHILELSLPPQHQVGSANHRTCDSRNHPVRSRQIPSDRHSLTLTQAIGVEATTGWEVLTATELLTVVVNSCDSCGSETEAFVGAFIFLPVLIRFRKLLYIVL